MKYRKSQGDNPLRFACAPQKGLLDFPEWGFDVPCRRVLGCLMPKSIATGAESQYIGRTELMYRYIEVNIRYIGYDMSVECVWCIGILCLIYRYIMINLRVDWLSLQRDCPLVVERKPTTFIATDKMPVGGKGGFATLRTVLLNQWMESRKLNHWIARVEPLKLGSPTMQLA